MRFDPLIVRVIGRALIYLALFLFTKDAFVAITFFGGIVLAQTIMDIFCATLFPGTWLELAKNFNKTLTKKIEEAEAEKKDKKVN